MPLEALESDLLYDIDDHFVNMVARLKDTALAFSGLLAERDIFMQLETITQVETLRGQMKVISSNPLNVLGNAMQKTEVWKTKMEKYISVTAACQVHMSRVKAMKHAKHMVKAGTCTLQVVCDMVQDVGFLAEQIKDGFEAFMTDTAQLLTAYFPAQIKELEAKWDVDTSSRLQSTIYEAGLVWPAVPVFQDMMEEVGKMCARFSGKQNMELFLKSAINLQESFGQGCDPGADRGGHCCCEEGSGADNEPRAAKALCRVRSSSMGRHLEEGGWPVCPGQGVSSVAAGGEGLAR